MVEIREILPQEQGGRIRIEEGEGGEIEGEGRGGQEGGEKKDTSRKLSSELSACVP